MWEVFVTDVTITSKYGSSASFTSLDFWPTRACLVVVQQKERMEFCNIDIVFGYGYKV